MASNQSDFEKAKQQAQAAADAAKKAKAIQDRKDAAKKYAENLSRDITDESRQLLNLINDRDSERTYLATLRKDYTQYVQNHTGVNNPGHPTQSELEHIASLDNQVSAQELIVDKYDKEIAQVQKDIKSKNDQVNQQIKIANSNDGKLPPAVKQHDGSGGPSTSSSSSSNNVTDKNTIKTPPKNPPYKYNVPMASDSYFNPFGMQVKELQANGFYVDAGNYDDARKAWKGQGGRGTIQMDKQFASNQYVAAKYATATGDASAIVDNTLYGFKFLYNPTTIGMAWGLQQETVPSFEASGQDIVNPIASGLVTSTLSFQLMLNRLEDMKYLDSNGLKSGKEYKTGVYPDGTLNSDLIGIYERGTMYDLEYLFRTIQGPSAQFVSTLNDVPSFRTADKGWLRPTIVEVHLGNALRYRCRITELSVNHALFDSRMVPLLSTVSITLARFNDFANPDLSKTGKIPVPKTN